MQKIEISEYRSIWMSLYRTPHRLGFIDAGGVRTRYLEAGTPGKPAVLALHGTAGTLEAFYANVEALAEHFHVFAIDMLGCGWTAKQGRPLMAPDYAAHALAFLDAVGIEEVSVIGVSLGNLVGTHMIEQSPHRVRDMVLVSPACIVPDPTWVAAVNEQLSRRGEATHTPAWNDIEDVLAMLYLHRSSVVDDMVAVRLDVYGSPEMAGEMPHLVTQKDVDYRSAQWWSERTQPLLVIAHVDAPNMFLENAYALAEAAPHAQLVELHDCDHHAQTEVPDAFNDAVITFLTR